VPEPLPAVKGDQSSMADASPTDFVINVHGESYEVQITGVGSDRMGRSMVYMTLDGMPESVVLEAKDSYQAPTQSGRARATDAGHVTTAMPGNIVEVLVAEGDSVKEGQPVLVTEAMKMETEVHARKSGKVVAIHVTRGDRVTPGEVLMEIE